MKGHNADDLAALAADVEACRRCPRLVTWRERVATDKRAAYAGETYWGRPVPGFGDPEATLLVVGLAPAAHGASRTGRLFTGDRSGDWLFRALHRAGYASKPTSTSLDDGLELSGAYITAAVRCAPPANKPTPQERDACISFLRREVELLVGIQVVVALGQFAFTVVAREWGIRPAPRFGHLVEVVAGTSPGAPEAGAPAAGAPEAGAPEAGAPEAGAPAAGAPEAGAPGHRRIHLLGSYHPSQQNTFTGTLTEEAFDAVFARARELEAAVGATRRRPGAGGAPARPIRASASC